MLRLSRLAVPTDAQSSSTSTTFECIMPLVYWYTLTPAANTSDQ